MKKRHSVEQIVAKLRQADVDLGKGLTVPGLLPGYPAICSKIRRKFAPHIRSMSGAS